MGKLHKLRRDIERNPEKYRVWTNPFNGATHTLRNPCALYNKKKGCWEVFEGGWFRLKNSYSAFIKSVLSDTNRPK